MLNLISQLPVRQTVSIHIHCFVLSTTSSLHSQSLTLDLLELNLQSPKARPPYRSISDLVLSSFHFCAAVLGLVSAVLFFKVVLNVVVPSQFLGCPLPAGNVQFNVFPPTVSYWLFRCKGFRGNHNKRRCCFQLLFLPVWVYCLGGDIVYLQPVCVCHRHPHSAF